MPDEGAHAPRTRSARLPSGAAAAVSPVEAAAARAVASCHSSETVPTAAAAATALGSRPSSRAAFCTASDARQRISSQRFGVNPEGALCCATCDHKAKRCCESPCRLSVHSCVGQQSRFMALCDIRLKISQFEMCGRLRELQRMCCQSHPRRRLVASVSIIVKDI